MVLRRRKGRQSVSRSGVAEASDSGVAISGVVQGDVITEGRRRVPPSDYVHQIRRIAAPALLDREAELAELAAFCTAEDGPAYGWWRAPAWSGKSALMAAFALDPPRGVQVVAFFVTARLAGQSNRSAFCEVVMRQLCTLLDQEVPPLTDATRDAALLHALEAAGALYTARGERLVLLVDGLDEDRGTAAQEGGFSIAALLPEVPPPGVRVLVAGRPDPPVPSDVHGRHPLLHDPRIVHSLSPSPHAEEIRRLAKNELRHIVHDKGLSLQLLGLITAAGGGLSGDDLAELAYYLPQDAEEQLRTVTGRSFAGRDPHWASDEASTVYILAHEELQMAAEKMIGSRELEGFRQRLHAWAANYQAVGWPPRTPEYLLRGYPRMLRDTGDLTRATSLALDQHRLNRTVEVSGTNTTTLEEVAAVIEAHLAPGSQPDLDALLRLAYVRDELRDKAFSMPTALAVCWALLDEPDRARGMITSGHDHVPGNKARSYSILAGNLKEAGRADLALAFAYDAVDAARAVDDAEQRAQTLASAAYTLGEIGCPAPALVAEKADTVAATAISVAEEAAAAARAIASPVLRGLALVDVAEAMGRAGDRTRAIELADAVEDAEDWADALAGVAYALGKAGRYADALEVFDDAPVPQAEALTLVAGLLADAGRHSEAVALAEDGLARAYDRDLEDPDDPGAVLAVVVRVFAAAGRYTQAAELAATIGDSEHLAQAYADLAKALARAGHRDRAVEAARNLEESSARQEALMEVARDLAKAGRHTEVAELVAALDDSDWAHSCLAQALAHAGRYHQAVAVAGRITLLGLRATTEARMACAFAQAGRTQQAVELAVASAATVQSDVPSSLLAGEDDGVVIAVALARAGRHEEALEAVDRVPELGQAAVLAAVAEALADAGQLDQAVQVAERMRPSGDRVRTLAHVAESAWRADHTARADELAAEAAGIARWLARETGDPTALADVAGLFAAMGRSRQADRMAHAAVWTARRADGDGSEWALAQAVRALAMTGRPAQARKMARNIASINGRSTALYYLASQLAQEGSHQQAITLAESITSSEERRIALSEIARQLARSGHHEQAIALARGNQDANALADIGSIMGDQRLVAEAIQTGFWKGSAQAVSRLSAPAFDAFSGWLGQRV
ncbi:hypothetical protein PV726_43030 [Streptomyces europaeiscabiei]|uniref:hypothetical protein n=1 Tax=Streptomyces europaeiscabiei TaxID=146819 RepID=UPI0029A0EDC7|nr:hypothetical protein [Streptomyces europaeiscabiei]MDX3696906.1 hypothetical protein [Streptomyces europaeiscabiei]